MVEKSKGKHNGCIKLNINKAHMSSIGGMAISGLRSTKYLRVRAGRSLPDLENMAYSAMGIIFLTKSAISSSLR